MLDALVASEGEPDLVQISGGEPTIHPQILRDPRRRAAPADPARHAQHQRHPHRRGPGLRATRWPSFRPGFEVYLQFDSLNDDGAEEHPRRRPLAHPPPGAGSARGAQHLDDAGLHREARRQRRRDRRHRAPCAAPTSACAASTSSRCRMPAATRASTPSRNRIVLSEIRRRIVEDSGVFADGDMIPLPCNPDSISIGYGVRDGEKVIPLTSLVPREALLPAMPNAISFEKYPELRRRFVDLLSLSTADSNTTERLGSLLCCLPDVPMPRGLGLRERLPRHDRGVPRPLQFLPGQRQALLHPFRDARGQHHPVRHLQHLLSSGRRRERPPGGGSQDERSHTGAAAAASAAVRPPPPKTAGWAGSSPSRAPIVLLLTLGCILAVTEGNRSATWAAWPSCAARRR